MDRLISLFSLYDFLGYVVSGAAILVGSYWAFEGLPAEPGAATTLALVVLSYAVGHAVQAVATVWEGWFWRRSGIPSSNRMTPESPQAYKQPLRELIDARIAEITGRRDLDAADAFGVARAQLRASQLDGRAELMNAMYGLCRGLATATGLLVPTCIAAAIVNDEWQRLLIGAAVMLGFAVLYLKRAQRYSYRFADQVWRDFAARHAGSDGASGSEHRS
ncbi:MAG TPA: hypothetical protein VF712_12545 [Thermoleophilaceae bacterium]|jgi:hypothetical protein